jgi:type III secretion protein T
VTLDAVLEAIRAAQPAFAAWGLGFARVLGLLVIVPVSTRIGLRGLLRASVAGALAVLLLPGLLPAVQADMPGPVRMLVLGTKEGFVGLLVGLLFAVPFWVAETAGELVDQQRGSRATAVPDPAGQEESGQTATLLALTLVTVFLTSGGMEHLLRAVVDSYGVWPVTAGWPAMAADTPEQVLGLMDVVLRAGFLFASPLVGGMVLAELSLALVGRFAPQLNVFDLSMTVKGLVYVVALPLYAVVLIGYLRDGLKPLAGMGEALRRLGGS